MPEHSRGAVRAKEGSKLLIKCTDATGKSFTEQSETHDISETGISFYLKSPVWVDTHLTITITSSILFGRIRTMTAKVIRIQFEATGKQLVAARFD